METRSGARGAPSTGKLTIDFEAILRFLSEIDRLQKMASNQGKDTPHRREPKYHIYVRLPFNRGDFVDPPPVSLPASAQAPKTVNGGY